jgi:hypothetical protein
MTSPMPGSVPSPRLSATHHVTLRARPRAVPRRVLPRAPRLYPFPLRVLHALSATQKFTRADEARQLHPVAQGTALPPALAIMVKEVGEASLTDQVPWKPKLALEPAAIVWLVPK